MSLPARREPGEETVEHRPPAKFWSWRALVLGVAGLAAAGGLGAYLFAPRSATALTGGAGSPHGVVLQAADRVRVFRSWPTARAPSFSLARLGAWAGDLRWPWQPSTGTRWSSTSSPRGAAMPG